MNARLFVALTPPRIALDHLGEAIAGQRGDSPELRWTDPVGWHLTLAFYGSVDAARMPSLEERLARAASRHPAIEARFRGAGAFSRPVRATVLFADVVVDGPQLAELAATCSAVGRRVGLTMDDRRFRPHLTLARARGREPVDMRAVVAALERYEGPRWSASDLVLMRSYLGPRPRYELLESWPLGAHQA